MGLLPIALDRPLPSVSHSSYATELLKPLPWQTEHQGVELINGQGQRCGAGGCAAWPLEVALVQAPRGAPDSEPVVHQELDAGRSRVGEELAVVRLRGTKDLHHTGQQPLGAGAHVNRLDGQPGRVDPDHRSISRSQVARAPARDAGQRMTIVVGPRVSSM